MSAVCFKNKDLYIWCEGGISTWQVNCFPFRLSMLVMMLMVVPAAAPPAVSCDRLSGLWSERRELASAFPACLHGRRLPAAALHLREMNYMVCGCAGNLKKKMSWGSDGVLCVLFLRTNTHVMLNWIYECNKMCFQLVTLGTRFHDSQNMS